MLGFTISDLVFKNSYNAKRCRNSADYVHGSGEIEPLEEEPKD